MDYRIILVVLLMLVPLFLYAWPSFLGGDTDFMIVQGNSMLPTIEPGSFVITKKLPDYNIDDIVSYPMQEESVERIIVHRIIEEVNGGFIIKGDNNPKNDVGVISPERIIGKVVFATPYVGYGLVILRNPLVMGVIAIFMIAIQSEKKRRKKLAEEKKTGIKVPEKSKRPDYSAFYAAMAINLLSYVIVQTSLAVGITPQADIITKFFFRMLEPSFASTISFGLYFLFIIGVYYMARRSKPKLIQLKKQDPKTGLLMQKESNSTFMAAQLLWVMFIVNALVHLLAMAQDLSISLG